MNDNPYESPAPNPSSISQAGAAPWRSLAVIEARTCDIVAAQCGVNRRDVSPSTRLIEDLGMDSLDVVELLMDLEETFDVSLPSDSQEPVAKAIFTRVPMTVGDLAEAIYVRQGSGAPVRSKREPTIVTAPAYRPFSQLGGRWDDVRPDRPLWERLSSPGWPIKYRRRSDGMRCVQFPGGKLQMGGDDPEALSDERPVHVVELDSFLIDAEAVSTTAYCRFLNSLDTSHAPLAEWFLLNPHDDRAAQLLIRQDGQSWTPLAGVEKWPMVLVSWFGANAYALWANGCAWRDFPHRDEFLPSEAQWEYAARDAIRAPAQPDLSLQDESLNCARHERGRSYTASEMPIAAVHSGQTTRLGLYHMRGNVWQWCRDWYASDFYQRPEALERNAVNTGASGARSERGGSWVGPAELCRPSYRRGRNPAAFGRCLGVRCVSRLDS